MNSSLKLNMCKGNNMPDMIDSVRELLDCYSKPCKATAVLRLALWNPLRHRATSTLVKVMSAWIDVATIS